MEKYLPKKCSSAMQRATKLLLAGFFLSMTILISCHSEKKLARGFVELDKHPALYITFAKDWELFFIKPQGTTSAESFARRYFPFRSYFLKNNGTAEVDSVFEAAMHENLIKSGFPLYNDSTVNQFLIAPGEKFIIEFVQMQIEEKTVPVGDTLYFANNSFIKFDTVISRVDLSFWLRINPLDDTTLASPLLYASFPLIDNIDGAWSYDLSTDSYSYEYQFTPFGESDIYLLFENSGMNLAQYIYDYFLNLYLFNQMHRKPVAYYSWNGSFLKKAGSERFIFMK